MHNTKAYITQGPEISSQNLEKTRSQIGSKSLIVEYTEKDRDKTTKCRTRKQIVEIRIAIHSFAKFFKSCSTSNYKNLKHLTITLRKTPDDQKMQKLGSLITRHLPQLEELRTHFIYARITDKGMIHFVEQVSKELTNLKTLDIQFYWCGITNYGIQNSIRDISNNLTKLEQLYIDFSWNQEVTDKAITDLTAVISKHLFQLKKFSIRFGGCSNLTDEAVEATAINITRRIRQLNYLKIDFSECWQIRNKGAEFLITEITKNLSKDCKVDLDFFECEVDDEFKENMLRSLTIPIKIR